MTDSIWFRIAITCFTISAVLYLCARASKKRESQRRTFPIGKYSLDDAVDPTGMVEFSESEYLMMGRDFEGEVNYNAPPVRFLNKEWQLQLATVNGKIYKIAPFIEFSDKQDAEHVMSETLAYCVETHPRGHVIL